MATTEQAVIAGNLQALAKRHLWMHFSRMGAYDRGDEVPIITRGEGCYVWDEHGNRYLDGLSALFCVNIGHGRADVAQAGADQAQGARLLHELVLRASRARSSSPRASPSLAPGRPQPRLLHQRRQRGRRVGDQARRASTTSSPATRTRRSSSRARSPTTARRSARSPRRASRACASPSSRSRPAAATSPTRTLYRLPPGYGEENLAEAIAHRIEFEGPDTVAAVILEPVQNAGGCFVPPRGLLPAGARDLRRVRRPAHLRRGHLLVGPPRRVVRRRSATTTSPTSSRRRRASPRPTPRWAR